MKHFIIVNKIYLSLAIVALLTFGYGHIFAQGAKPTFQDGVYYLSREIAKDDFENHNISDLAKVDSLYRKAVTYFHGDISEALLSLTFATLPFNRMPIKIPIIGVRISLRLPSVYEELFLRKNKNIPGIVYFDSPISAGEDKDKVAHFFGNAFLAYNVSIFNVSKFLGMFVEMFESEFKVSGGVDFRDLQTNYLGEYFGESLNDNPNLLPSDFFNVYSLFYFSYN